MGGHEEATIKELRKLWVVVHHLALYISLNQTKMGFFYNYSINFGFFNVECLKFFGESDL